MDRLHPSLKEEHPAAFKSHSPAGDSAVLWTDLRLAKLCALSGQSSILERHLGVEPLHLTLALFLVLEQAISAIWATFHADWAH